MDRENVYLLEKVAKEELGNNTHVMKAVKILKKIVFEFVEFITSKNLSFYK